MRSISSHLLLLLALVAILVASLSNAQAPPLPAVLEKAVPVRAPVKVAAKPPAQAPPRQPASNPAAKAPITGNEKLPLEKDTVEDGTTSVTVFNGQDVPTMTDMSGTTMKEDISKGYWLVEAFSPYCHHCKSLAPKWQTLYEYYYTSDPLPASTEPVDTKTSLNSFSRYYNIKFAKLDCVAFGTACSTYGVKSYPSIILFKDGEEIKRSTGDRSIKDLSKFIEEVLETIRPGSRPTGGVSLPEVGASSFASTKAPSKDTLEDPLKDTDAKSTATKSGKPAEPEKTLNKPMKEPHTANPNGTSIALNGESFDANVRKSLDPWFVKFYVPWCGHCQKLAPGWNALAREMKGRLDIGEVNCDVEKQLCRDHGVRGYPAIMLFKGPERVDYDGLRGVGDLVKWANSAVEASSGVKDVTADEFEEMETTEEVIFLYFHDVATTTEDLLALERLPLHLIGRAKLVKTSDTRLVRRFKITTWPRLLVSRSGSTTVYDQLAPQDMRNVNKVVDWMQSVWLPLVPELSATNARDILDGKYVVLGILNRDRPEDLAIAQRELKSAAIEWLEKQAHQFQLERQELRDAKQLRIEEAEDRNDQRALGNAKRIRIDMNEVRHKEVGFAWVDGIFWERWIRTTFGVSAKDGEKVIINDEDNRRYWDNTVTGNHIVPSRTSILETLSRVVANPPKLPPKPNGSTLMHHIFRARMAISSHAYIAIVVAVVCSLGILFCCFRSRRKSGTFGSNTGGFFQLDGNQSGRLLGGGLPNGKAD